jgi:glycosyltransferase involved in cell wall biosynthesis
LKSKNIIFVADLFVENLQGGAELVNEQLINLLRQRGHTVTKMRCPGLTIDLLRSFKNHPLIFGSIITLAENIKNELSSGGYNYVFYEHDHKYLTERNPAKFVNFKAPKASIVNVGFYENAKLVLCQSSAHEEIINKNLNLSNTVNLGSSLWGENFLNEIASIPINKTKKYAIVASDNPVKNQAGCENFCKAKGLKYDIVSAPTPISLARKMSEYEYLIFFPTVPESLCRVAVEAKMVGCKIITNNLLGASSEPWFSSNPEEIINEMRRAPLKTLSVLEDFLAETGETTEETHFKIIVPTYNSEKWIGNCINSIKTQGYKNFECIVINDCSTDNTLKVIQDFVGDDKRFQIIDNESNLGALCNIYNSIYSSNPDRDDVIVTVDGDDRLAHPFVLGLLDQIYTQEECWITYGNYVDSLTLQPGKFSKQIPHNIIKESSYRENPWSSSHLRTFKFGLWDKVKKEDLIQEDGKFYQMAWDLSFMIPMLEMARFKSRYIPEILYWYNNDNPLNDHKKNNQLQVSLEHEIRSKKKYSPLMNLSGEESLVSAKDLLSPYRIDVMAKYLYAKHRELGVEHIWAKDVYLEHLKVWNGFNEVLDKDKNTQEDFISSFNSLLDDVKKNGFDSSKSKIPLHEGAFLLNGSHRVAACLLYDEPLAWIPGTQEDGQLHCSLEYLQNKKDIVPSGLHEKFCNDILIEYVKQKKSTRLITLFPSVYNHADEKIKEASSIIRKYTLPIFHTHMQLNHQGSLNLIENLYKDESWLGSEENNFPGVHEKRNKCFTNHSDINFFVVDNGIEDADYTQMKEEIRQLFPLGKHSIHINDEHHETVRLIKTLFQENGQFYLNNSPLHKPPKFKKLFEQYKIWLKDKKDADNFCVGGSAVLSAFGLRDCQDLDYLCHDDCQSSGIKDISCHNGEISKYQHTKDEIIFHPYCYFYVDGVKFSSLEVIRALKEKRGEPKDIKDVELIDSVGTPSKERNKEILNLKKDSSYNRYVEACEQAVLDETAFQRFKMNPDYQYELEHTNQAQAIDYIRLLKKDFPKEVEKIDWDMVRKNDVLSETRKLSFKDQLQSVIESDNEDDYVFSPTTLQYLWIAFKALNHHLAKDDKSPLRVVEIGAGYGGQCFMFHIAAAHYGVKVDSYKLVDLKFASALQSKYLTRISHICESLPMLEGLGFVPCLDVKEGKETFNDTSLIISNYCLSEISKEWGEIYLEKIIKNSSSGFIQWNNETSTGKDDDTRLSITSFNKDTFPGLEIKKDPGAAFNPKFDKYCRLVTF